MVLLGGFRLTMPSGITPWRSEFPGLPEAGSRSRVTAILSLRFTGTTPGLRPRDQTKSCTIPFAKSYQILIGAPACREASARRRFRESPGWRPPARAPAMTRSARSDSGPEGPEAESPSRRGAGPGGARKRREPGSHRGAVLYGPHSIRWPRARRRRRGGHVLDKRREPLSRRALVTGITGQDGSCPANPRQLQTAGS